MAGEPLARWVLGDEAEVAVVLRVESAEGDVLEMVEVVVAGRVVGLTKRSKVIRERENDGVEMRRQVTE